MTHWLGAVVLHDSWPTAQPEHCITKKMLSYRSLRSDQRKECYIELLNLIIDYVFVPFFVLFLFFFLLKALLWATPLFSVCMREFALLFYSEHVKKKKITLELIIKRTFRTRAYSKAIQFRFTTQYQRNFHGMENGGGWLGFHVILTHS